MAALEQTSGQPLRFGVYELDARGGVLRKSGVRIHLQEQPLQILTLLLERPGEIVTREAICKKLWPEGTFVDFDHSLNAAVMRLREALDDDADSPRFIETVPRRGYRFLYPVETATPSPSRPRPRTLLWVSATASAVLLVAVPVALNVGGLRDRLFAPANPAPQIRSIAVLPLKNLMNDPEQDYFVEGMHDALITELSKISGLTTISRTSMLRFKQTDKSIPQIARELNNVDAIVEGSVLREGDRVRISVQLIHASSDRHLWAQTFDRDLRGILALYSDVARAIANEVRVQLTSQEQARLARSRPVDSEAYQAYLRGRYHWNKRTPEGIRKAVEHFQHAIEKDPTYALAYAGLADGYNLSPNYAGVAPMDAFPKAKAAAEKALEIDQTLAEAHTSLAWGKLVYDWDWSGAEAEFKRALELNPNYVTARYWYGLQLAWAGKVAQGSAELKHARELDPLSQPVNTFLGLILFYDRQYDQAIQQLKETVDLDRNAPNPLAWLGENYLQKGMYREGIAALENAVRLDEGQWSVSLAELGYAYAMAGQRQKALGAVEKLKALSKQKHVSALDFAYVHLGLGDKEQTFLWLEKAYEERATELVFLKVDPRYDPLRSDPRYKDLLRRMNFPHSQTTHSLQRCVNPCRTG